MTEFKEYNETIGNAIAHFDKAIKKAGFSFDAERKILSILRSIEYQVEIGTLPSETVIRHLQAAILAWIEISNKKKQKLTDELEICVDIVIKEIGRAEHKH